MTVILTACKNLLDHQVLGNNAAGIHSRLCAQDSQRFFLMMSDVQELLSKQMKYAL